MSSQGTYSQNANLQRKAGIQRSQTQQLRDALNAQEGAALAMLVCCICCVAIVVFAIAGGMCYAFYKLPTEVLLPAVKTANLDLYQWIYRAYYLYWTAIVVNAIWINAHTICHNEIMHKGWTCLAILVNLATWVSAVMVLKYSSGTGDKAVPETWYYTWFYVSQWCSAIGELCQACQIAGKNCKKDTSQENPAGVM